MIILMMIMMILKKKSIVLGHVETKTETIDSYELWTEY